MATLTPQPIASALANSDLHMTEYAAHQATRGVFFQATVDFGGTAYQLGKMLGNPHPSNVGAWLRGERRPSHLYMTRLVWLYHLLWAGLLDVVSTEWRTFWNPVGVEAATDGHRD